MYKRKWHVFCIAALGIVMLGFGIMMGVEAADKEYRQSPVVLVAHRAGASHAPENTIAALEQAILDGAPMAEVDVQQLKDGTLIVMHDSNFKRTTGVDKNVWDVDYEEMCSLGAISCSTDRYLGERVPTLEEMLQCADDRICLMLELKYTGQELELEESVLRLLQKYQMEHRCIIGSMNSGILERMKELDPGLETVYIAHNLQEEQLVLPYADSYSIEAKNLTREMTASIHAQGKPVYAWTINDKYTLQRAMDCGADGIVTDDIPMVKKIVRASCRIWSIPLL